MSKNQYQIFRENRVIFEKPQEKPPVIPLSMRPDVIQQSGSALDQLRTELSAQSPADIEARFGIDHDKTATPMNPKGLPVMPSGWLTNVMRRKCNISTGTWDTNTRRGLAEVRRDWILAGIPAIDGNTFYDSCFNQLAKSYDIATLESKAKNKGIMLTLGLDGKPYPEQLDAVSQIYRNPFENKDKLATIDKDYYQAWQVYYSVKLFIDSQKLSQDALDAKATTRNDTKGTSFIKKWIGKAWDQTKDTWRENPLALSFAVVGAVLIWKWFKSDDGKGSGNLLGIAMGAGLIATVVAASDSIGDIDLLEKLKIKEKGTEFAGTALEPLHQLVPNETEGLEDVFLATLHVPVASLYSLYKSAGTKEFIDPGEFYSRFTRKELFNEELRQKRGKELFQMMKAFVMGYGILFGPNSMTFAKALETEELKDSEMVDLAMIFVQNIDKDRAHWDYEGTGRNVAKVGVDVVTHTVGAAYGLVKGATVEVAGAVSDGAGAVSDAAGPVSDKLKEEGKVFGGDLKTSAVEAKEGAKDLAGKAVDATKKGVKGAYAAVKRTIF